MPRALRTDGAWPMTAPLNLDGQPLVNLGAPVGPNDAARFSDIGEPGPQGPQGPEGPPGPEGPAGTIPGPADAFDRIAAVIGPIP